MDRRGTGVHGCGVNTPAAAAVADATAGFDSDMHTPDGTRFTKGTWSMMVAEGKELVITRLAGNTTN